MLRRPATVPPRFARQSAAARTVTAPPLGGRLAAAAEAKWPRYFALAVAFYAAVMVSRVHESVTILTRFYAGKVGALLVLATALAYWSELDFRAMRSSVVVKCIGVITVLSLLSVPGSAWMFRSVEFFQTDWSQALVLFFGVVVALRNRRAAHIVVACVTAAAAFAAARLINGGGWNMGGRVYIGGGGSSTYDPNQSAALFVAMLPYAIMFATRPGKMRWVGMASVPLLVIALIKTSSRGGIVAFGVLCLAVIAFAQGRDRGKYAAFMVLAVVVMSFVPHSDLVQRFQEISNGSDYNFEARGGRIEIWKMGMATMLAHPLLGIGAGAYEAAAYSIHGSWATAHNSFVQIGVELGVGGFVTFIVAIVAAFRAGLAARRSAGGIAGTATHQFDRALATASLCSLAAVITAGVFLSMAYSSMVIFALAVPTALVGRVPDGNRGRGGNRQPRRSAVSPFRRLAPAPQGIVATRSV